MSDGHRAMIRRGAAPRHLLNGAFFLTVAAVCGWIAWRNAGLYPVVLPDEYFYSMAARLRPLADAAIPNYLFYWIYRSTNACGAGFLDCARLLNLGFFVAGLPFVYLVARRVASHRTASVVCLITLAGPLDTYTAYFMPESLYFLGFWIVAAQALCIRRDAWWLPASLGATVGSLALVKPHALFLLPGLVLFDLLGDVRERPRAALRAARTGLLCGVAVATKFGLGWLLAGDAALTWLGRFYGASASAAHVPDGHLVTSTIAIFGAHLMALAFLFALPSALLTTSLLPPRAVATRDDPRRRLAAFTWLIMGSLVVGAAAFTAGVSGQTVYETVFRLHQRYYDFCFPLLVILAVARCGPADGPTLATRVVVAIVLTVVVGYAVWRGLIPYVKSVVDAPTYYGLAWHTPVRVVTAVLGIASLIAWCASPRHARTFFLVALLPWMLWRGDVQATDALLQLRHANVYDAAGAFARGHVPRDEAGRIRVVGDDQAGVYRTLFQIGAPAATWTLVAAGAPVVSSALPPSGEWLVVVGEHAIDRSAYAVVEGDGFLVARRLR